jgi:DNA-binding transcriptional ArsR family regulator
MTDARMRPELAQMHEKVGDVSALLAEMANPRRLLVLCTLVEGERSAGELAALVGLSPGALSQHLQRLRALALVATRRDGQTINYRLADGKVREILETLHRLYCGPGQGKPA